MPEGLGPTLMGDLRPCPETPNCVHTGMRHPAGTEGIFLRSELDIEEAMDRVAEVVESMPRAEVVSRGDGYLHAEYTSFLFRFVDDVEFLVAHDHELLIRSASRIGRSDLGANAKRVAAIRERLAEEGLLR